MKGRFQKIWRGVERDLVFHQGGLFLFCFLSGCIVVAVVVVAVVVVVVVAVAVAAAAAATAAAAAAAFRS